ncbi:MAG: hypothetical protein ABIP39_08105, partial [Polyangiaceae bacterium]
ALGPALYLWNFTVDDALIPVRYARHLADGAGYRFNVPGDVTDGVTPLAWPFVLAPFAHGDALAVLMHAKYMNLLSWLGAAAMLGSAIGRAPASRVIKAASLVVLALVVPVAAHAVSGLETGLAIALGTAAAVHVERAHLCAILAGLAASLRPEMLPWALVLTAGAGWVANASLRARIGSVLIAGAPFALAVLARLVFFGRAAPLSLLAKPSDLTHGVAYAGAAAILSLTPIVAFAPLALVRSRTAAAIAGAGVVHVLAVAFAGGDWMPYARLMAPIAPSLLYAFVLAAPHAHRVATSARVAVAVAVGAYFMVYSAPQGRHVQRDREALAVLARPFLVGARSVATLDIGWPSAATEAPIIDLAGLTDPEIAVLPGGHTSKRVDVPFLLARKPEYVLVFVDKRANDSLEGWRDALFTRVLEARFAESDLFASHFRAIAFLPLGDRGNGYFLLKTNDE